MQRKNASKKIKFTVDGYIHEHQTLLNRHSFFYNIPQSRTSKEKETEEFDSEVRQNDEYHTVKYRYEELSTRTYM